MEVTIRQLEYLVALAELENFGRAAEQCFVTQPALSAQIAQLEKTLGVQLVERGRKVSLTPAGEIAVVRAQRILTEVRDLRDEAAGFQNPLVGRIRLGALPTVAPYVLPRVMPMLRERYPRLRLSLREAGERALVAGLHAGELDVLLLTLGQDLGPVEEWEICHDSFLLLAPPSHPLIGKKGLTQADLLDHELLLLEDGHGLHHHAVEAFSERLGGDSDDLRASSLHTLVRMVASGQGITLIPEIAVATDLHPDLGLALARFDPPEPKRVLGLVWRRGAIRMRDFRLLGQGIRSVLGAT